MAHIRDIRLASSARATAMQSSHNIGELRPVLNSIEESKRLLEYPDNWDGEGSPGYSKATWERATGFVRDNAIRLWTDEGEAMEALDIQAGAGGRIVLDWSVDDRELILTIPVEPDEQAEFYGYDHERTIKISGKLDLDSPQSIWLLLWTVK